MFNRKRKIEIKNRLISLVSLLLLALLLIDMRIYYVQKKYSTKETGNFKGNHKQYENISDLNYSLLDIKGESIFQYDTKYKVVIDSMAFRLNNLNQNLENIRLAVKLNYCNFATEILHLTYFHLKQTVKSPKI